MKEYITHSPEETENLAIEFSKSLLGGEVIAFLGGMGMGKTHFTRGLAKGLNYTGDVNSPTFAIVNEYRGGKLPIFHFDMYRIEGWEDLYSSGFFDYMEESGVIVAEWSENIIGALEDNTIFIKIEKIDDNTRKFIIEGGGN